MSACKYYDCGWCYAPDYLKTNAVQGGCFEPEYCPSQMSDLKFTSPSGETTIKVEGTGRLGTIAPKTQLHIKMDEPVQYETPMTDKELIEIEIAYFQEQIKVKQKKLKELEQTKSPVKEAYKDWWGDYPELETDSQYDDTRWAGFQAGYEFAYKEKVSEEPEEQKWDAVRESVKWCEENPDKDPLDWLKPQTPEETERGMRTAFREAQQTEKWKELQRKIDEEDNDKNFKNSLDLIKEWGEKNKPLTLKELLWEWWEDIFTVDSDLDADASIDVLVDRIAKEFIPPSSDRNSYEWEKCLKMMRGNLR